MLAMLAWASCVVASEPQGQVDAGVLWYEEQEPGTDVYPVRILVTTGHLRIDDGVDGSDFVLLDRRTSTLYSVNHEEQSTVEIKHQPAKAELPDNITMTDQVQVDHDAPSIGGKQPQHVTMTSNGSTCYEAIIVPGLLGAVTSAMAEYARVLGDRQLNNLQDVPAEIQTPCFLTRYAYAPDHHYQLGLPVQEWDGAGYRRSLVNFSKASKVSRALFEVPASYRVYRLGG
jgi:hypothetical protein